MLTRSEEEEMEVYSRAWKDNMYSEGGKQSYKDSGNCHLGKVLRGPVVWDMLDIQSEVKD